MRLAGLALLLCAGCVTTTEAQRIALATIPGTPESLTGATGVGLGVRMLTGDPVAQPAGGAVALPSVQPELGVVVQPEDHTRVNARLSLATGAIAKSPPSARALPNDAIATELAIGAARDIPFNSVVGGVVAGELGASLVSLTEVGTHMVLLPSARASVGLYAEPGPVRLFTAVTLGTGTWNDFNSVVTKNCSLLLVCTEQSTGTVATTAVALAGAGVRWQIHRSVSLTAEGWLPLTAVATRLPFTVGLTLRLGELDFRPGPRKPASPAAPTSAPAPVVVPQAAPPAPGEPPPSPPPDAPPSVPL